MDFLCINGLMSCAADFEVTRSTINPRISHRPIYVEEYGGCLPNSFQGDCRIIDSFGEKIYQ